MNQHSPLRGRGSLLERAAEAYDLGAAMRAVPAASRPQAESAGKAASAAPAADQPVLSRAVEADGASVARPASPPIAQAPVRAPSKRGCVDREALREAGYVLPDEAVTGLAEEFRIVKRQLLLAASGKTGLPADKRRLILIGSAYPDEGKTFSALNLALSMAGEPDVEILLVDGDFPKPEILTQLGLEAGRGLVDALADPSVDPESLVIQTDIPGLSVLPAGRQVNNVTELLASERTHQVLELLSEASDRRIIIFDSPPALVASPASALAGHVGQLVLVVRADKTTESTLREAVGLLSGCENVSLLLNGVSFPASGRRFGTYYGYGE